MLFVLNKEKIMSYMITFSTIAILMCISVTNINRENAIETSGNALFEDNKNHINNVIKQE